MLYGSVRWRLGYPTIGAFCTCHMEEGFAESFGHSILYAEQIVAYYE